MMTVDLFVQPIKPGKHKVISSNNPTPPHKERTLGEQRKMTHRYSNRSFYSTAGAGVLVAFLLAVMMSAVRTDAYNMVDSRRQMLGTVAAATIGAFLGPESAQAVISSKYCAYGTGDGCEDLAEGNEYIKQLQARSAANKETIQQEARNAYYMKNYPDWFATVGKTMVKKPDGSFLLVDDGELQKLKDQNKIGLEYAKTMGGRVMDVTQKPILTLKE